MPAAATAAHQRRAVQGVGPDGRDDHPGGAGQVRQCVGIRGVGHDPFDVAPVERATASELGGGPSGDGPPQGAVGAVAFHQVPAEDLPHEAGGPEHHDVQPAISVAHRRDATGPAGPGDRVPVRRWRARTTPGRSSGGAGPTVGRGSSRWPGSMPTKARPPIRTWTWHRSASTATAAARTAAGVRLRQRRCFQDQAEAWPWTCPNGGGSASAQPVRVDVGRVPPGHPGWNDVSPAPGGAGVKARPASCPTHRSMSPAAVLRRAGSAQVAPRLR